MRIDEQEQLYAIEIDYLNYDWNDYRARLVSEGRGAAIQAFCSEEHEGNRVVCNDCRAATEDWGNLHEPHILAVMDVQGNSGIAGELPAVDGIIVPPSERRPLG